MMVEVELSDEECFLKVRETLTRIGIASKAEKVLTQSCHILHKKVNEKSKYFIVHFKELFTLLDKKECTLTHNDLIRRDGVIKLLAEWGLISIIPSENYTLKETEGARGIKIIPYNEKANWKLVSKYELGKK